MRPVVRQVDVVHQCPQSTMVTCVEGEGQPRQVAELCFVVFLAAVRVLMKVIAQAQVGEGFLHVFEGALTEFMVHANHELMFEPARIAAR